MQRSVLPGTYCILNYQLAPTGLAFIFRYASLPFFLSLFLSKKKCGGIEGNMLSKCVALVLYSSGRRFSNGVITFQVVSEI